MGNRRIATSKMKQVFPTTIQSGAAQTGNYILTLYEPERSLQVPIIVGQHEAQGIMLAQEAASIRRPLTHQLILHIMEAFGLSLKQVTIDRVVEGVFYATLHLTDGFNEKKIDSRTTDAVTQALHCGAPILMDEKVLEETGVRTEKAGGRTEGTGEEVEELEKELRRCEEEENYERAAEIQKKIERLQHGL